MKWSDLTEKKLLRGERAEAPLPRSDVSFRLHQKTANFEATIGSRAMQWSDLTEEKQKNQLAQTEFRFITKKNNKRGQLRVGLRL